MMWRGERTWREVHTGSGCTRKQRQRRHGAGVEDTCQQERKAVKLGGKQSTRRGGSGKLFSWGGLS
jgi:hypothetical protein